MTMMTIIVMMMVIVMRIMTMLNCHQGAHNFMSEDDNDDNYVDFGDDDDSGVIYAGDNDDSGIWRH